MQYLNVNPAQFNWNAFRQPFDLCMEERESPAAAVWSDDSIRHCLEGTNLLYYSKDESKQTDFSQYHWLITERTNM